jgi:hypothetical protein
MKVLLASTLLATAAAHAASFRAVNTPDGQVQIAMQGEIRMGDFERFEAQVKAANQRGKRVSGIRLDSPGGNLAAAIELAAGIEHAQMATIVPANAKCVSACFYVWMVAKEKWVSWTATMGVHANTQVSDGQESAETEQTTVVMARIAKKYGAPASVLGKITSAHGDELEWLSPYEVTAMGAQMMGNTPDWWNGSVTGTVIHSQ